MSRTAQMGTPRKQLSDKPFSSRGAEEPVSREFMRDIEKNAALIRQKAGVGPEDKLDPFALVERFGVMLVTLDAIEAFTKEDRARIESIPVKKWSGGGMPLPQGDFMVILHPKQTLERAAVTMMEEVAHAHYGHKPTRIYADENGVIRREFDPKVEQQAYWTAAATLLPSVVVARRVFRGVSSEDSAADFSVSVELVVFRIKIWRLWSQHRAHHQARKAGE